MANTPGKFKGPSIQPVGAGRAASQKPGTNSTSKKLQAQLTDLERVKLEGDPLTLYGSGTEPNVVSGAAPAVPPVPSIGDRLVFYEKEGTNPYKVAIGVDDDRTLWFQSTGGTAPSTEVGGFDWHCDGSSTGTMARRMRLTPSGKLVIGTGAAITNARVRVSSGIVSLPFATVSGGGTLSAQESVIIGDASGGTCTVNLPAAADSEGCVITVKRVNSGANTIVVDGSGAETIDGAATKTLGSQYACIQIYCDGSTWHIIAQMGTVT